MQVFLRFFFRLFCPRGAAGERGQAKRNAPPAFTVSGTRFVLGLYYFSIRLLPVICAGWESPMISSIVGAMSLSLPPD